MSRNIEDKIKIYLAGYDPLDNEDVAEWEKGDHVNPDNIFKFFFQSAGGSRGFQKGSFDDMFKAFRGKGKKIEDSEEDDEEEEFLKESRRRKEEKRRNEEQERIAKMQEERKKQEDKRRAIMEAERKKMREEHERKIRELEEKKKIEDRLRKKQEQEEWKRMQEARIKMKEQQERENIKRRQEQQEIRRMQDARYLEKQRQNFDQGQTRQQQFSQTSRSRRRESEFKYEDEMDLGSDNKPVSGKKSRPKSKKKSKRSKKSKKSKKKGAKKKSGSKAQNQRVRSTDGKWYERASDGTWTQVSNRNEVQQESEERGDDQVETTDTYTNANGDVFVKGSDGSWYMRVTPPPSAMNTKDHVEADEYSTQRKHRKENYGAQKNAHHQEQRTSDRPTIKIIPGGVFKDPQGRIVDREGTVYTTNPDGTLRVVRKISRGKQEDIKPQAKESFSFQDSSIQRNIIRDKNGVAYYKDPKGNYIRVHSHDEVKQGRPQHQDNQPRYSYREESTAKAKERWTRPASKKGSDDMAGTYIDEYWEDDVVQEDRTDSKRGFYEQTKADKTKSWQTNPQSTIDGQMRAEIMRQEEILARRLMDAELQKSRAQYYEDEETRRRRFHEEL